MLNKMAPAAQGQKWRIISTCLCRYLNIYLILECDIYKNERRKYDSINNAADTLVIMFKWTLWIIFNRIIITTSNIQEEPKGQGCDSLPVEPILYHIKWEIDAKRCCNCNHLGRQVVKCAWLCTWASRNGFDVKRSSCRRLERQDSVLLYNTLPQPGF